MGEVSKQALFRELICIHMPNQQPVWSVNILLFPGEYKRTGQPILLDNSLASIEGQAHTLAIIVMFCHI